MGLTTGRDPFRMPFGNSRRSVRIYAKKEMAHGVSAQIWAAPLLSERCSVRSKMHHQIEATPSRILQPLRRKELKMRSSQVLLAFVTVAFLVLIAEWAFA